MTTTTPLTPVEAACSLRRVGQVGAESSQAERVVMALTDTGFGHLVNEWRDSTAGGVIKVRSRAIQTEDEARAMHRAIRLAQGKTTPGNFDKWVTNELNKKNGWNPAFLRDRVTAVGQVGLGEK